MISRIIVLFLFVGMATNPSTVTAYINAGFKSQAEADQYYRQKRNEQAREAARLLATLNEAIQRDPNDAVAYFQRGKFHSQRDPKLALADFDNSIRLNPKFTSALLRRSSIRAALEDYAGCRLDLEEALRLDPSSVDIRYRLAALYYASPDESIRDLAKARELSISQCEGNSNAAPQFLELLAAACAELGDFDAAVNWETKIYETRPNQRPTNADYRLNFYRRGETVSSVRNSLWSAPAMILKD